MQQEQTIRDIDIIIDPSYDQDQDTELAATTFMWLIDCRLQCLVLHLIKSYADFTESFY